MSRRRTRLSGYPRVLSALMPANPQLYVSSLLLEGKLLRPPVVTFPVAKKKKNLPDTLMRKRNMNFALLHCLLHDNLCVFITVNCEECGSSSIFPPVSRRNESLASREARRSNWFRPRGDARDRRLDWQREVKDGNMQGRRCLHSPLASRYFSTAAMARPTA